MKPLLFCLLTLAPPLHAQIHVDEDAAGADDGSSWQDAFTDLQSALAVAGSGIEVWVAEGTYRPSQTLDRSASFLINAGVQLYGGFAGTEVRLADRAGLFRTTILSGDLAGDDEPGFVARAENSLHVVQGLNGMRLDGFTIQGGNANAGTDWDQRGGGLRVEFYFIGEVHNCIFIENEARSGGGAVYSWFVIDTYEDCVFLDNRTDGRGGAIWMDGAQTSYARIVGCRFHGNVARGYGGGAVDLYAGSVVNSVFTGNSADGSTRGGGALRASSGEIVNSSFYGNSAVGAGVGAGGILIDGYVQGIHNSILWGNVDDSGASQSAQILVPGGFLPDVTHTCIQGWDGSLAGGWNVTSDPRFVDPDGVDDRLGTLDDDLRLLALSPCVDAADEVPYADNAGPLFDVAGRARFVDSLACDQAGAVLDIGALERQVIDGTTNYCPATPSSQGVPAVVDAPCAPSVTAGILVIAASPVPRGLGLLHFGPDLHRELWGNGVLCVGGRLQATAPQPALGGTLSFALDLTQPPGDLIQAGSTWSFQVLYRDRGSSGAGFNLSDAARCTFRP